jgi:hypothetical protein
MLMFCKSLVDAERCVTSLLFDWLRTKCHSFYPSTPKHSMSPCQLQSIDLTGNEIPDSHAEVYEFLARLPLAHSSIADINLGGGSSHEVTSNSSYRCQIQSIYTSHFAMLSKCRQQDFIWVSGKLVQGEQGPAEPPSPLLVREDCYPVSYMHAPPWTHCVNIYFMHSEIKMTLFLPSLLPTISTR